MYTEQLHDLLGKTVTVRSINNDEFIGKLISMDEDFIVMQNPRSVLINGPDVILGPFLLTAKADIVPMQLNNILCVVPTLPEAEKDYKDSVLEEANAEGKPLPMGAYSWRLLVDLPFDEISIKEGILNIIR